MAITWQPVNPELHDPLRTEVLSAQGHAIPVEDYKYTGVSISSYNSKLSTMAELGFDFGSVKSKVDVAFFMLELACYTDTVLVQRIADRKLMLERRGLAVRVGIANWGIDFRAASTIAAVAANAQLRLSSTSLEVVISGRSAKLIQIAEPISRLTTFSADALMTISECTAKLADYFESDGKTLEPVKLQVAALDVDEFSWLNTLYSGQLATESIWRRRTANASLDYAASRSDMRKYLVPSYVRSVYASIGIGDGNTTPTEEQRQIAVKILDSGRY